MSQTHALNPAVSAWVSAHAGTGKTWLLTHRVARMLLEDETLSPRSILALTFTKAAALEMEERLTALLLEWNLAPPPVLHQSLTVLLGTAPQPHHLHTARGLVKRVLAEPVGFSTIHAFAQHILQQFPLEAGVDTTFTVLEESEKQQLVAAAIRRVMSRTPAPADEDALSLLYSLTAGETSLPQLLHTVVNKRHALARVLHPFGGWGGITDYCTYLAKKLNMPPEIKVPADVLSFKRTHYNSPREQNLKTAAQALLQGGKKAAALGGGVLAFLNSTRSDYAFENYLTTLLKDDGAPRALPTDKKTEAALSTQLTDILAAEQTRILALLGVMRSADIFFATEALLRIAKQVVAEYETQKTKHGALDFDDLTAHTHRILTRADMAEWVRFRLDSRITHLLIDEAQDTDETQLDLLTTLMGEMASGTGQHAQQRSLFVVGDIKQSIYRFRGATTKGFFNFRTFLENHVGTEGEKWHDVRLETSRRSTTPILALVDSVFADPTLKAALGVGNEPLTHHVHRGQHGGRVKVFPLIVGDEKEEALPWQLPEGFSTNDKAFYKTAKAVANLIGVLTNGPEKLSSTGSIADFADIMVLVRTHEKAGAVLSALQQAGIPAVVENSKENKHWLVADVKALITALHLPDDDVALAHALRSPLISLSQAGLEALCLQRPQGQPLWQALRDYSQHNTHAAAALARLEKARGIVSTHSVPEGMEVLLSELQAVSCATTRAVADVRLLPTARAEIIQVVESLTQAAQAFTGHGWLAFVGDVEQQIKIKPAHTYAVRIMTVHAAKGLEAPVVIMPETTDATVKPDKLNIEDDLIFYKTPNAWVKPEWESAFEEREKHRQWCDELRLLYVALTRARDQLYILGAARGRDNQAAEKSWYSLITQALEAHPPEGLKKIAEGGYEFYTLHTAGEVPATPVTETQQDDFELPNWLATPTPLLAHAAPAAFHERVHAQAVAFGTAVHAALEKMPAPRPDIEKILHKNLPANQAKQALAQVQAVVEKFPAFFSVHARAEVPIATPSGEKRIDRLVIENNAITIIDFKTDSPPPALLPAAYRAQLNDYRTAIAALFPTHTISCGIVWVMADPPRVEWL